MILQKKFFCFKAFLALSFVPIFFDLKTLTFVWDDFWTTVGSSYIALPIGLFPFIVYQFFSRLKLSSDNHVSRKHANLSLHSRTPRSFNLAIYILPLIVLSVLTLNGYSLTDLFRFAALYIVILLFSVEMLCISIDQFIKLVSSIFLIFIFIHFTYLFSLVFVEPESIGFPTRLVEFYDGSIYQGLVSWSACLPLYLAISLLTLRLRFFQKISFVSFCLLFSNISVVILYSLFLQRRSAILSSVLILFFFGIREIFPVVKGRLSFLKGYGSRALMIFLSLATFFSILFVRLFQFISDLRVFRRISSLILSASADASVTKRFDNLLLVNDSSLFDLLFGTSNSRLGYHSFFVSVLLSLGIVFALIFVFSLAFILYVRISRIYDSTLFSSLPLSYKFEAVFYASTVIVVDSFSNLSITQPIFLMALFAYISLLSTNIQPRIRLAVGKS